jgi:hypothetical protein
MARWSNGSLAVYHGTDSVSANVAITAAGRPAPFSVQLSQCRPATDFGRGFYTTTSVHQAQQWANSKVRRVRRRNPTVGLVLKFDLDRDRLASLESLVFVRPIQDYWDFVTHCRSGGSVHGRVGSTGEYDVVYGLVTMWPSLLLIQDCDQISFHTNSAVGILPNPTVAAIASATNGLF